MGNREKLVATLIGAIVGLARATEGNANKPSDVTHNVLLSAMYSALPGMAMEERQLEEQIRNLHREKERLVPRCGECAKPCGRNEDFDLYRLGELDPELTALKDALLFGLLALEPLLRVDLPKEIYYTAMDYLYKGFFFVGYDCEKEHFLPVLFELGAVRASLINARYPDK